MTGSITKRLSTALGDEFRRWFHRSSKIFMPLDKEPILYREVVRSGEPPKKYGFIDLPHLLRSGMEKAGLLEELLNWSRAARPFALVSAARLAARLAEQLGVEPEFPVSAVRELDSERALRAGLNAARESARAAAPRVVAELVQAVGRRPKGLGLGDRASRLRIRAKLGRVFAEWRDRDSRVLQRESLEELLDGILARPARELAREVRRGKEIRRQFQSAGDDLLERVCPDLARISATRPPARQIRIRMFRAERLGIPMDAWIVIHPLGIRQELGACTLSVRRGHDSFVLESVDGRLFYFAPCVLVAPVSFNAHRWWPRYPLVSEPQNGYRFHAHPYTGLLTQGHEPFTDMGERTCSILPEITPLEGKMFPALLRRAAMPAANDLCLAGQSDTLRQCSHMLMRADENGEVPDVLGFFVRVLDIARRGLTYSHQKNLESPRTSMVPGSLPYVITAKKLPGPLAERVFPFDPDADPERKRRAGFGNGECLA